MSTTHVRDDPRRFQPRCPAVVRRRLAARLVISLLPRRINRGPVRGNLITAAEQLRSSTPRTRTRAFDGTKEGFPKSVRLNGTWRFPLDILASRSCTRREWCSHVLLFYISVKWALVLLFLSLRLRPMVKYFEISTRDARKKIFFSKNCKNLCNATEKVILRLWND